MRPPLVIAFSFRLSLSHLHTCPFCILWALQRCGCLPEQICLSMRLTRYTSPVIPVRQYRRLQSGFLQCMGRPKPPCHLLMLPSVTSVHKGLTPFGKKMHLLILNSDDKFAFFKFIQNLQVGALLLMQGTHIKYRKFTRCHG